MDLDFGTIVFFLAFLWFVFSEVRPKGGRKGTELTWRSLMGGGAGGMSGGGSGGGMGGSMGGGMGLE